MVSAVLVILIGAGIGVVFLVVGVYTASRGLRIEQRGGSLVVVNSGAEVRAALIRVSVAGQALTTSKALIPRGETVLQPADFSPACPTFAGTPFQGGSVTGSRSVIGIGVDWTWYSSGPLTVVAEAPDDTDPP